MYGRNRVDECRSRAWLRGSAGTAENGEMATGIVVSSRHSFSKGW
jgi:hypothetical protein